MDLSTIQRLNAIDTLCAMLFINSTPEDKVQEEDINEIVGTFGQAVNVLNESAAMRQLSTMAKVRGYIDEDGSLSKKGQARVLTMFKSGKKTPLDYTKLVEHSSIKELLALVKVLVPELQKRIGEKEAFTPNDRVKELLETSGDILLDLAGVEVVTEEVPANS